MADLTPDELATTRHYLRPERALRDKGMCERIGGHNFPPHVTRRGDHRPDPPPCALCNGDGEIGNPGNADPAVKVTDWLPPIGCPRCGQSGKDPNP